MAAAAVAVVDFVAAVVSAAAAVILSLESVFAAVFGWWLLGEQLVSLALIGCALIFIAVIIAETLSESAIKRYVRAVLKR